MSVMLGERRGESCPGRGSRKEVGYSVREAGSERKATGDGKVGEGRKG